MEIIVFNSGGKDSQASLIWAIQKYGVENCTAVLMDTVWENPVTYTHIKNTCELLGVKSVMLKSSKYNGFVDLAKKKGRFPSTKARFCTEELKVKPAIDYVLSKTQHLFCVEGIRASESASRGLMKPECTYFKYYFEPYRTNTMIVEKYKTLKFRTHAQEQTYQKAVQRIILGKEDAKYYTYRKKDVIKWCKQYNADKIRPFFYESAQFVINYILQNGQTPNPLYYMGASRVGCFPCIMSKHGEIKLMIENQPEEWQKVKDAETEVGRTFFPPDYIPKRFCTGIDKKGIRYPTAGDVEHYIRITNATSDIFQQATPTCMSAYNLCE